MPTNGKVRLHAKVLGGVTCIASRRGEQTFQLYFIVIIRSQPSSSSCSSCPLTSSRTVTAKTSVFFTRPCKLQDPKQSRARVDGADSRLLTWDRTRWPQLNNRLTSTDVAYKVLLELI